MPGIHPSDHVDAASQTRVDQNVEAVVYLALAICQDNQIIHLAELLLTDIVQPAHLVAAAVGQP